MKDIFTQKLIFLYGQSKGYHTAKLLEKIIKQAKKRVICSKQPIWNEKDIALITYADSFQEKNTASLQTLKKFLIKYIGDNFSIIHILPFFPYSSDRGFSIVDYTQVKKEFGDWEDIVDIAKRYRLMADLVLNHISTRNSWFQKFLQADRRYWQYFIHFDEKDIPHQALKKVFRPRSAPLLTPFDTAQGRRFVWTTFSVEGKTDQVDINFQNPQVLIEIIKIILFYLEKGVRIFRLDAVAYIWKKLGTSCKHLPQVHAIVSLMRAILDVVCPSALIITETNVPHEENIAYFGDGYHEAQMIYNFSLPSLVLHSFYNGSAVALSDWAQMVKAPTQNCTFFNFLDTHDGIGVLGAKGILSERQLQTIFDKILDHGGRLSYRLLSDGGQTVYEMNSTWWSALNKNGEEPFELQLRKFITSRAIAMSLAGVPAVYYLSMLGAANDIGLFTKTGIKRDLNRSNLEFKELDFRLSNPKSKEAKVFKAMIDLIKKRKGITAFHPNGGQEVLIDDPRVFMLIRKYQGEKVLAAHNVSKDKVRVRYRGLVFDLDSYSYAWIKLAK